MDMDRPIFIKAVKYQRHLHHVPTFGNEVLTTLNEYAI